MRHDLGQLLAVHAEDDIIRLGRICQRSQDIEYRADTELSADRTHKAHTCMITLRKEEGKPHIVNTSLRLFRSGGDLYAECLKYIGCTAFA